MTGGSVVAVVPVRALRGGKVRLAGELTADAREALTRQMLRWVVGAARDSGSIGTVVVVSPDPAVLALARTVGPGVVALPQVPLPLRAAGPEAGLNAAIAEARDWAVRHAAAVLLVLFADLPLLTAEDVRNLVRRDAPVVLAPDRHGTGTNALLIRFGEELTTEPSLTPFRFAFGVGSYARHVEEADRLGLEVATALMPGTAFDLDTPADWRRLVGDGERVLDAGGWIMGDEDAAQAPRFMCPPSGRVDLVGHHPLSTP